MLSVDSLLKAPALAAGWLQSRIYNHVVVYNHLCLATIYRPFSRIRTHPLPFSIFFFSGPPPVTRFPLLSARSSEISPHPAEGGNEQPRRDDCRSPRPAQVDGAGCSEIGGGCGLGIACSARRVAL